MLYSEFASAQNAATVLYDADCTTIIGSGTVQNTSQVPPQSPANYYLTTPLTAAGGTLTYLTSKAFNGDDAYEPNDNLSQAQLINANSNLTGLRLFNDDWFKFYAPLGQLEVKATFDTAGGKDLGLFIYDAQGVRYGMSFNGFNAADKVSDGRKLTFNVPAAGTYYLGVNSVGASFTGLSYSLTLYHPAKWVAQFDQYGPIFSSSITLADVDGDGYDEILVGTNKRFDASGNEVAKAALLCIRHDGTLKWAKEFPGMADSRKPGISYATTSISSTPVVGDIDGDGRLEIVIGVGSEDIANNFGDRGGVYAIDAKTGATKWFHESIDYIGGATCAPTGCKDGTPDGRPDGVFSSPLIRDIDHDGKVEVIYGGLDQRVWVLDGRTGLPKPGWPQFVLDTVWSSPAAVDLNGDGVQEILIGADITANPDAQTQTGGLFHVFSSSGLENIAGFSDVYGDPKYGLHGKWEDEVLWSSPETGDIDGDGQVEIAYGTGNYNPDSRGSYIRVWNQNGTSKFKLATNGKTFATPLFADLEGNGTKQIIAVTLDGYLHVWNSNGTPRAGFPVKTQPFGDNGTVVQPIFGSPLAVDLNGDGKLEIVYAQGAQIVVVDSNGVQLSDGTKYSMVLGTYSGSPAIKDIDRDGELDIIAGGNNVGRTSAIVYRFRNDISRLTTGGATARYARRQFREPSLVVRRPSALPAILLLLLE